MSVQKTLFYDSTKARHSSVSNEHYSPIEIVSPARLTLGTIDLDPASCAFANELVRATVFHDIEANGFARAWQGNVFLNPPGGESDDEERRVIKASRDAEGKRVPGCRESGACGLPPGHDHSGVESSAKKWWFKLAREFQAGSVTSAIFVGFSLEILQTTQVRTLRTIGLPLPLDFPMCVPAQRTPYDRNEGGVRVAGENPPHASVIACLTRDAEVRERFVRAFSPLGRVVGGLS